MSQIGSYALHLALALSVYSFLAGMLALLRRGPGSERLGKPRGARASRPSPLSCLRRSFSSPRLSGTITRWHTSSITAIVTSPRPTSSPPCGQGRKVHCFSGRCYWGTYWLVLRLRHRVIHRDVDQKNIHVVGKLLLRELTLRSVSRGWGQDEFLKVWHLIDCSLQGSHLVLQGVDLRPDIRSGTAGLGRSRNRRQP